MSAAFGDNDTLCGAGGPWRSAADELVLLTDVDRLYSGNPRTDAQARPIEGCMGSGRTGTPQPWWLEGGASGATGGRPPKLTAAPNRPPPVESGAPGRWRVIRRCSTPSRRKAGTVFASPAPHP